MRLDSLKTFNEIKLSKINLRHKRRFTAGDIKMETNGIVGDAKQMVRTNFMQLGVSYASGFLQKQIFRFIRNRKKKK